MSENEKQMQLSARLGAVCRAGRKRLGHRQWEVAEKVGIAPEVYGRLERGRMLPSVLTLVRLCEVLQVRADVLLGFVADVESPAIPPRPPLVSAPAEDAPEVRRLLMRLRRLAPKQLRRMLQLLNAGLGLAREDKKNTAA